MEVNRYKIHDQFVTAAAEMICGRAVDAVEQAGVFHLMLAGGGTPRPVYQRLTQGAYHRAMPWEHIHLFWGDERCVPPGHESSNYRMVRECLLDRAPVPMERVHRIQAEVGAPEDAAAAYEQVMRAALPKSGAGRKSLPVFDLILLGMGADGHTASLFPEGSAVLEKVRWMVASAPPEDADPHVERVTVTLPVINNAKCVAFLVSGGSKQPVLQSVLAGEPEAQRRYPAARVAPEGELVWFVHF